MSKIIFLPGKWMSHDCDTERHYMCKRDYHATKTKTKRKPFSANWATEASLYWPLERVVKESVEPFGIARGAYSPSSFTLDGGKRTRKVLPFDGFTNFLKLPLPGLYGFSFFNSAKLFYSQSGQISSKSSLTFSLREAQVLDHPVFSNCVS